MSPTPLIELQRRLSLVGAIRAGGEKPERGAGRRLDAWRLTSPTKALLEQAAQLYGGTVTPWAGPTGEQWQVYTEAAELPILVMPAYSVRQSYELWQGATRCERICDGEHEELTDGPCICNAEGVDKCDLYTRLTVALPELDTVLGWRLITRGIFAGLEIPTAMKIVDAVAGGQTFVPAKLRLEQRRSVKDQQVTRFVVPTIDLAVGYLALGSGSPDGSPRALEPGHVPVPRGTPTVEQALDAVSEPAAPRSSRQAPFGPGEHVGAGSTPLPEPEPTPTEVAAPAAAPASTGSRATMKLTEAQAKKLNVLVGKLRPDHLTTEQLYTSIAGLRQIDPGVMAEVIGGRDPEGVLHWAPLRDSLLRPEAVQLIDWLVIKEGRVKPSEAAGGFGATAAGTSAATPEPEAEPEPKPEPVPYGQFPEGF
jgi:hypothetical protein